MAQVCVQPLDEQTEMGLALTPSFAASLRRDTQLKMITTYICDMCLGLIVA